MHRFLNSHRPSLACLIGFGLLAIAGCSTRIGDVTGTITYQGKTVASGTVVIAGSDSLPYYGIIQEDGAYTVAKVPIGLAKITVVSPGPDALKNMVLPLQVAKGGVVKQATPPPFRGDPKKWFPIPEEYRDFAKTKLTVTVMPGVNRKDMELVD